MKLLLDEMYTGLKEYLQTLGWNVLTVHDVKLVGASDKKIVEYAKKHKLLLVTQDEKHADLASLGKRATHIHLPNHADKNDQR